MDPKKRTDLAIKLGMGGFVLVALVALALAGRLG